MQVHELLTCCLLPNNEVPKGIRHAVGSRAAATTRLGRIERPDGKQHRTSVLRERLLRAPKEPIVRHVAENEPERPL